MKRISLILMLIVHFYAGYSQSDYNFDPGYRVPDNTTHYYKFAVLPASTSGTGEMLTITLIGGYFGSEGKKIENMYFGNRNGFRGIVTQKFGAIYDYLRIEAYTEIDASASLYYVMDNSYSHGKLFASTSGASSENVLITNPQKSTGVPSGTKVFSSTEQKASIRVLQNGNIGIGTDLSSNPSNYKLAVNGTIGAKEIKVEMASSTWSDFVFTDRYQLMSIKEVENFINEKKHLPDIPTSKEVEENGLNIGEFQAKLLQKIEELTLYAIEQNKKILELKKQDKAIEELRQMVKLQNEEIQKLKDASK